jgi:hypothetical protein
LFYCYIISALQIITFCYYIKFNKSHLWHGIPSIYLRTNRKTAIMKKILYALSIVFILNACNTNSKTASNATDTAGLALFQAAQVQHEKDSIATWTKDSIRRNTRVTSHNTTTKPVYLSENATTTTSQSSNTAKRSRLSKTAKGAIIGGVAGAAGGAIINKKNRAAGAVIGGVIGAGTGAVIGNGMDKKDGRH